MNAELTQAEREKEELEAIQQCVDDPILWIKAMWGLTPQPFKTLAFYKLSRNTPLKDWKAEWFGKFVKGKHLTWQQFVILLAVRKATRGEDKERISIAAGVGVGKSSVLAMIILWFLYNHDECLIPCTAPSESQLYGALWKELRSWRGKMPIEWREKTEITNNYATMIGEGKEKAKVWWARAKTARDDRPEALAGIHANDVLIVTDESSAISRETFTKAEGALTSPHLLFVMISNPTRTTGYFYDSHHKDSQAWQTLTFANIDSPIVNQAYVDRVRQLNGEDSDEWRFQVLGLFPRTDAADGKGYTPLFAESSVRVVRDENYIFKNARMGIDPAGQGGDTAVWILRDSFRCKKIGTEKKSTPMSLAQKTMGLMEAHNIKASDVYIDACGSEAVEMIQILERHDKRVNAVNVGDDAEDEIVYENKKAENYDRMRKWTSKGGEYLGSDSEWEDLGLVRKKQAGKSDRMKIKTKEEMRRDKESSPDTAEAVMISFTDDDEGFVAATEQDRERDRGSYQQSRRRLLGVKL